MKLKTILRKSGPEGRAIVDYVEGSEVDYDAAAAHAFWLAIHEQSPRMRIKLHERALTIMRSWGFDSGEVE